MSVRDQRKLGVKLAKQTGAHRTLEAIKRKDANYESVFRQAAAELGVDKVVELVLAQNERAWVWAVLRHVDCTEGHRDALLSKAAALESPTLNVVSDDPTNSTQGVVSVAAFELDVLAGASYSAYFTLNWANEPNVIQPIAGYAPNTPPYKWSDKVLVGQSATNICKFFSLPQAPLNPGATVWMIVDVSGGGWYNTNFYFTYDPLGNTVVVSADGGTVSATFTWRIKA
jgi:hypothetical protein